MTRPGSRCWPLPEALKRNEPAAAASGSATGDASRADRRQREDPLAFLADRDVFGDLAGDQRFVAGYTSALDSLHLRGARATLESLA
jgi:mannitol-1-phosphate/altronate dehydrogenase